MNKTTNQIETQGYVTPEVKVYAIKPSIAMMSNAEAMRVNNDPWTWSDDEED